MYILMDYHTTCEECGQLITGVIARHVANSDSALLSHSLNNLAGSIDAVNAKKGLEKQVRMQDWKSLNFSNGHSAHRCPHCGAHQSWENMPAPVEPKKTHKKNLIGIIALAFLGAIVGMLLGLFILVFTNNAIFIVIPAAIFAVIGAMLGNWTEKADAQEAEESYPQRLKEYQAYQKEYQDFQESLKSRKVHNIPQINTQSARISRMSDEQTEVVYPGLRRML